MAAAFVVHGMDNTRRKIVTSPVEITESLQLYDRIRSADLSGALHALECLRAECCSPKYFLARVQNVRMRIEYNLGAEEYRKNRRKRIKSVLQAVLAARSTPLAFPSAPIPMFPGVEEPPFTYGTGLERSGWAKSN